MNAKDISRFLKNEFVYGGHLLSLGAVSIVYTCAILLNIKITWDFLVITYLITQIIYCYNRFIEFKSDFLTNPSRTEHLKKYISLLPPIAICFAAIIFLLFLRFGSFYNLIFCFAIILGGLLYTEYFKKLTKKIVGLKSIYVSFFWALLVPFLAIYYNFPLNLPVFLLFLFVFLRFIVSTIFFDIKDIDSDKLNGLKTLPVSLGEKNTLTLLHVLNIFSFFPLVAGVYCKTIPPMSLSLIIFCFYSYYYLKLAHKSNVNIQKLSYIMVDGEYVLWSIVITFF